MMPVRTALARLAGRPLAMAPRQLDALLATTVDGTRAALTLDRARDGAPAYAVTETGIAIIPVIGPLVARHDWLSTLFGASSYGEIGEAVESAAADPAVRGILLEVDSPGGEVGGLFDLVERLGAIPKESGRPLWAVASEAALSAAYAIASAADQLYVTRTGEVGSVGVVAVHVDESAADAMAGLKWTLIHAGARKVDGNPHQPLSATSQADIQADVDALHAELVNLVAGNRGLAPDMVRATQAAIYRGARGVEIGFADRIGSVDQALADLAAQLELPRRTSGAPRRGQSTSSVSPRSAIMTTNDVPTAPPPDATLTSESAPPQPPAAASQQAPLPTPASPTDAAASAADALRAEFAEIMAIAAQGARLGVTIDAADAMRKGIKPDALRRSILDALAARAEATSVVAVVPTTPSAPSESPIVKRARERAAASRN
jgi:ClpP class serine protease